MVKGKPASSPKENVRLLGMVFVIHRIILLMGWRV
ncbi:Hypothetical protein Minf_0993 [Methylacidiphilum infernorum V4]|uniref:Uncharacterized protein n=1 Tax=Methylacidiphilum infernorum (isolate V4) TaxID=481448 RepID=B3DUP5_METI4|nr:Hypothetical protein Minf_0993 [Methylacidiphilum infernorum V4]